MTEMHVPAHITLTRRIAQQEAAAVTALTVEEQQLTAEYDKHQAEYEAERARLDAELRDAAEKAKAHLDNLAAAGQMLNGQVQDVGRRLRQHSDEATDAQQTVLDWCTRRGINVTDLPPLRDTGPMPAIAAPAQPAQMPYAEHVGHRVEVLIVGDQESVTGQLLRVDHAGLHVLLPEGEQTIPAEHVTALRPAFGDLSIPAPAEPKLPSLEVSDAVLEAGRRAADPGATRVDAGGDQPEPSGPFPDGVESPAGPRPKRNRRRPQSDRVNEQDGDA